MIIDAPSESQNETKTGGGSNEDGGMYKPKAKVSSLLVLLLDVIWGSPNKFSTVAHALH